MPPIPRPPIGGPPRPTRVPPVLTDGQRHSSALYLLDAGVGFAFAHARLFPELVQHYENRLVVVDTVVNEWRARSANWTMSNGQDPTRDSHLGRAGTYLVTRGVALPGLTCVTLPEEASIGVGELVDTLAALHPPITSVGAQNAGECASVWEGRRRMDAGVAVVVLCADDDRARRLAAATGLGCRCVPQILAEMVAVGTLTPSKASDAFKHAVEVSEPRLELREAFSAPGAFERYA